MLCRWLTVDQVEIGQVGQALSPANPRMRIAEKRSHKKYVTQFAMFSSTCSFSPPAWYYPRATFESGKELRSSQSSESTSPAGKRCFLGGTETSGGCDGLAKSSWVKVPMGPSTEETWNRLHNPETWLMLRRK
jgi:hypothetical protein